MYIKQMHLCDTTARNQVDLRDYAAIIEKCVRKAMIGVAVEVNERFFTIISDSPQTYSEAVKIGRHMGQTDLGKYTRKHLYKYGADKSLGVSNKIFIEVKKPKGRIIIDDGEKEREIMQVLAKMSEDKPIQEQQPFAVMPIGELEAQAPCCMC